MKSVAQFGQFHRRVTVDPKESVQLALQSLLLVGKKTMQKGCDAVWDRRWMAYSMLLIKSHLNCICLLRLLSFLAGPAILPLQHRFGPVDISAPLGLRG
jgi:hypothetical protein